VHRSGSEGGEDVLSLLRRSPIQESAKVPEAAEPGVDAVVVSDVVPAVPSRRRVDRVEPDRRHAEPRQIVQPSRHPSEVADAVTVGVLEEPNVDR
jgi:hypothetical protein